MSEGRRRTANLRKLVRIATEYEAHDGRDLRGFLDHAAARAAFSDRESEAAAASEDHAGVRVMTVHAAKGLEFDTVAVADLGRSLCSGGQPPELRIDFDAEEIADASGEAPTPARVGMRLARAAAESIDTEGYGSLGEAAGDGEAEESGRLVYVAASRAERRLILSGVYADKDLEESEKPRRTRTALGCLLPGLGVEGIDGERVSVPGPSARAGLEGSTSFGEVEIAVRVIGAGAESAQRLAEDRRAPSEPAPVTDASAAPLIALADGGAAAARSLSYVALADYGRCGYRFLIERVIGLGGGLPAATPEAGGGSRLEPDAEGAAGLDWDERHAAPEEPDGLDEGEAVSPALRHARMGFGRAVHELLEWSARNGWTLPDERVRAAALAREGAAPDTDARLLAMLEGWLASPLLAELRDDSGGHPAARGRVPPGARGRDDPPRHDRPSRRRRRRRPGDRHRLQDRPPRLPRAGPRRGLPDPALAVRGGGRRGHGRRVGPQRLRLPRAAGRPGRLGPRRGRDRRRALRDRGGGRRDPRRALRGHLTSPPRPLPRLPRPRQALPPPA